MTNRRPGFFATLSRPSCDALVMLTRRPSRRSRDGHAVLDNASAHLPPPPTTHCSEYPPFYEVLEKADTKRNGQESQRKNKRSKKKRRVIAQRNPSKTLWHKKRRRELGALVCGDIVLSREPKRTHKRHTNNGKHNLATAIALRANAIAATPQTNISTQTFP